MSSILKKVWVINRSSSSSSSSSAAAAAAAAASSSYVLPDDSSLLPFDSASLGAFDRLPTDVVRKILKLTGPKDAARICAVSRGWNFLASDNRLWIVFLKCGAESRDAIVFAETMLRSGFPSMMHIDHPLELSFMQIFGQRAKVPGSIIIDGGSGYCKYGWSKYSAPSGRCATFLEFGNIEAPMYSRLRHFFLTIYSRMQVKPSSQPITVSLPICHTDDTDAARASRKQLRETLYSVLFDMNVPAVCAVDQAVLALYAARRISGIVVNIGFHATSIVPILRGKVMREIGVESVGQGALKLTGFLRELLQQRNVNFESLYTVRTVKEKLCYVALDYDAELRKDTQASCDVAGEGRFTISRERFQTTEILFQPQIGGVQAMALHQAVALCMDHCAEAEVAGDDGWFKTIVLAGGSSCFPGLPERLDKELHKIYPSPMSDGIKVIRPVYGGDAAWFGAKIVSNVSTFSEAWCVTRKQFNQKLRLNPSFAD